MKFGCCGNLVAKGKDRTGIEIVEKIAAYGYDYIELPLAEMMELSDEEFKVLKERVESSGIRCEVCNNLFPAYIRLTGPDVDMNVIEQYLRQAFLRVKELSADTVVFGSGTAKNVPEGFPLDKAYEQVVTITKLLAPIAKENGITVVIEPIRLPECNLINSFAEGVALVKEVNEDNIKVLIDYYHMTWEHEPARILLTHGKKYLRHVHFANPNMRTEEGLKMGRIYPAKEDEWDYQPFIDCLKACGYDGRISIEAGAADFDSQAAAAIDFLKRNF